jgi:hypothetical protein
LATKFKEVFPAAGSSDDGIGSNWLPCLHDQGGVLNPCLCLILNATGKPKAILNQQKLRDIHELALARSGGGSGMPFAPTYQWA